MLLNSIEVTYQYTTKMEYLNDFHKETTERTLKSIAEMKKLPLDFEKEYERHKKMKEDAIKAEIQNKNK